MKMLHGTDPASIKMVSKSPNGYYLDQNVIDKFNISKPLNVTKLLETIAKVI